MQQTMRWFGPNDNVKLIDIRQAGAAGIVTALHQIPVGDVWTVDAIKERQEIIRNSGLEWTVVESLPVHEEIKRASGNYLQYIENYKISLQNLAECGIKIITYNFMPILDWVRTNHNFINEDGSRALLYNQDAFTYFDVFLLKRPNSENDYSDAEKEKALQFGNQLSEDEKALLFKNVLLGLPGSKINFTAEQILSLLENYAEIDNQKLRENLIYFLSEVTPIAEKNQQKLAIHPDDPPFSVLGLPRIVSTEADLKAIFNAVPSTANGLCYCTGSLSADPKNNLEKIIADFGDRIHFLHLRNTIRESETIFRESEHLNGDVKMEIIVEKLLLLMNKTQISLPMRPDHGFLHRVDEAIETYPGYSLTGRLKGLAELRGLEMGIAYKLNL
ncbi:mannonate dehydratase [Flavobacterium johnsoniae]|uniref:Mannonate dehydratase n=1 Tax=Flavobacterium johnsoniae (strain ATCC 17061 / DSM 2064 / JCM 8514 / BCRC 14874 / CCUG 350202 / NBRC 14942 / NCIMB 11054 / UW101) TaxID=376686 RepID=A5FIE4_FLAJ1|nr:D-mannonate dehydratase [Flavobacterium johnsoniae UW101]SHL89429.1 D-mannonate dehydratase [Flavobacterium johnsoniae]